MNTYDVQAQERASAARDEAVLGCGTDMTRSIDAPQAPVSTSGAVAASLSRSSLWRTADVLDAFLVRWRATSADPC